MNEKIACDLNDSGSVDGRELIQNRNCLGLNFLNQLKARLDFDKIIVASK